ncbi:MAG: ribosomal protein S18-alanine N-acetyltransferase [Thermomicrobiales bacterium]
MYVIEPMTQEDVEEVGEVERVCFTNPWPLSAYRRELRNVSQNHYIVLRDDPEADRESLDARPVPALDPTAPADEAPLPLRSQPRRLRKPVFWPLARLRDPETPPPIIGFAGMWQLFDEAHVTTIGVHPDYRGKGLGELLFVALIDEAIRRNVAWLTLEVRVSNAPAQHLYQKYGFTVQGRRPRYYSDNNEDAYIMWSESLKDPAYRDRLARLRRDLIARLSGAEPSVTARTRLDEASHEASGA